MSWAIVLTFLKKIPLKDWAWLALAVALFLGALHERHEGAEKIERKDAALRAAAIALNKASENLADIKELNVGTVYEKYITLPPVASTGLVCHKPTPVEPSTPADRPQDTSAPAPRANDVFDPSGALLTDARDADAQINALIDTVNILIGELEGKK